MPADVAQYSIETMGFHDLVASIRKAHDELKAEAAELNQHIGDALPQNGTQL